MWVERVVDGSYSVTAAHTVYNILAAANKEDGSVSILSEEHGSTILSTSAQHREAHVVKLHWHPSKRLLAVGWSAGTVGVWSDTEEILREGTSHTTNITCLEWNSTGTRLISCDEEGEVVVWKVDVRGKINSLCHYRLKGPVSQCSFRRSSAKAENKIPECSSFFLTLASLGKIFYADDMGRCSESIATSKILSFKLFDSKDQIALITHDLVYSQYSLSPDGKMNLETEVKISTAGFNDPKSLRVAWVDDNGVIAIVSGGSKIRVLDVVNEESTMLSCAKEETSITSIVYCPARSMLCASNSSGSCYLWKYHLAPQQKMKGKMDLESLSQRWQMLVSLSVEEAVESIIWGGSGTSLIVRTKSYLKIFEEEKVCCATYQGYSILQLSASVLRIFKGDSILEIDVQEKVKKVAISASIFVVSTGTNLQIFDFPEDLSSARLQSAVNSDSNLICVDGQSIFAAYSQKVDIFNMTGSLKNTINVGNRDGTIRFMASSNNVIAIITSKDILKVYDLSRREPRFITSKSSQDSVPNLKVIQSMALNKTGTLVAYTGIAESEEACNFILIYSLEKDMFFNYDMRDFNSNPVSISWGCVDQRILVCETSNDEIFTFFVSYDQGILFHDRYVKPHDVGSLIGVSMPYHYFTSAPNAPTTSIVIKPATDFIGIENADPQVVSAIIEFCYQVDIDNVDEAFKALNKIENERVWKNLAKICVKKRRVDVATVCLANIKHAKAVGALRRVESEGSVDLKAAILASFLDMTEEVEEIYEKAKRFDLLNIYYQDCGQWEMALEVATTRDRINLKTTYVKFGRYLMDIGDRSGAIAAFEKGQALCSQVPPQIFNSEMELKSYAIDTRDKSLKKWWAQYEESRGNLADALKFYDECGDSLSIVRLHCANGRIGKAIELSNKSNNPAAAYHIARYYERENKIADAIEFYGQAKCYTQAIRLAKEHNLINQLINLALQGTEDSMLDVANYLEATGANLDKAITLYHRAGQTSKAIDLCFQTREFHVLDELASSLGPKSDPELLSKCARFFIENEQYEHAVALLTTARQYREALSLCIAKNITLTEDLVDRLGGSGDDSDADPEFLNRVAELCMQQKSYHLACKKFSQAGDKVKAMKCLLRSNDVERIIFFANVSGPKQKEIYVIAANFLQTLDWRSNANVMKSIITFYTKSRAFESLAAFYDSCCQVEIDEYQNYEKALGALKESAKCLSKAPESPAVEEKVRALVARIAYLETFVQARASNDPREMLEICDHLLSESGIDRAVRVGDIFALMIETHYSHGNMEKARQLLGEMQARISSMNLEYYLDASILRSLRNSDPNLQQQRGEDEIEEDY
ncbi:hypothetical protein BCR33DRAFT_703366 [Rhizoclosmatium globosum]|uniref:Uncharacterized protein n=1 Tax=Rhizoclosmatium globosum TaxID=329046 RepID=A0A1Y2B772_9FUNG|nr:hypothetical protein BCR33DRAFT_703366 [Rhizoclosmatium globosum]|eukprot:ORY30689.1 hypothetical protein BCR33DRAFT_703366 [Rhizoclosmatium globosum]